MFFGIVSKKEQPQTKSNPKKDSQIKGQLDLTQNMVHLNRVNTNTGSHVWKEQQCWNTTQPSWPEYNLNHAPLNSQVASQWPETNHEDLYSSSGAL